MLIQFWRIMLAGARNFMRNAWLSTAATAVMTVTLSIIVISFIANSALTATIKDVTDKIDDTIYLNDNVTTAQVQMVEDAFKANSNVKSIAYTSKDQALADYRQANKGNATLLQAISETSNPLPASIKIKAKNPNNLDSIVALANRPDLKALQSDPQEYSGDRKATIDRIVRFSSFFKTTGLVASVLFVVISTLIIFNTIRMAIFTRRDEIEIMKLVGATKWFIRGPFLFEAAMYGIIAAVIALALSYGVILGAAPKLSSYLNIVSTVHLFHAYPAVVIIAELLVGILIGVASSMLAMVRYLKL